MSERVEFQCPTCGKLTRADQREALPHRPFCSQRCKYVDLGKWLDEEFRVSRPLGPDDTE